MFPKINHNLNRKIMKNTKQKVENKSCFSMWFGAKKKQHLKIRLNKSNTSQYNSYIKIKAVTIQSVIIIKFKKRKEKQLT